MRTRFYLAALATALGLAGGPAFVIGQQTPTIGHAAELVVKSLPPKSQAKLIVTSPSFKEGADIPYEYTQYRGNIFPGLNWTAGPAETRSYAVIVQGESLSRAGAATSIHLTLFNIPASVTALKTGMDLPRPARPMVPMCTVRISPMPAHTPTPLPRMRTTTRSSPSIPCWNSSLPWNSRLWSAP